MAGNVYVLSWALRDYFGKSVDPAEYLVYLKHSVAFARWLGSTTNRERLRRMLGSIPRRRERALGRARLRR
jgi:hypothetical protein